MLVFEKGRIVSILSYGLHCHTKNIMKWYNYFLYHLMILITYFSLWIYFITYTKNIIVYTFFRKSMLSWTIKALIWTILVGVSNIMFFFIIICNY